MMPRPPVDRVFVDACERTFAITPCQAASVEVRRQRPDFAALVAHFPHVNSDDAAPRAICERTGPGIGVTLYRSPKLTIEDDADNPRLGVRDRRIGAQGCLA
jgi:hypothetical protein